ETLLQCRQGNPLASHLYDAIVAPQMLERPIGIQAYSVSRFEGSATFCCARVAGHAVSKRRAHCQPILRKQTELDLVKGAPVASLMTPAPSDAAGFRRAEDLDD